MIRPRGDSDKEWGRGTLFFSLSPAARYVRCADAKEFHVSPDSMRDSTFEYAALLLANEKNLEAAEWLFRVRHILTRSCPAKGEYEPKTVADSVDGKLPGLLASGAFVAGCGPAPDAGVDVGLLAVGESVGFAGV